MSWLTRTTSSLPKRPLSILRPITLTTGQTLLQLRHQQRTYNQTTPRLVHPSSSPSAQQSTTVLHEDHLTNPNFPSPASIENEQAYIDTLISSLPLVQSLRQNPTYKESRPHHSMDPSLRSMHFVAGSLAGKNKVTVAPLMWMSNPSSPPSTSSTASPSAKTNTNTNGEGRAGSHLYSIFHIGGHLCGHPGYVHGGLLSVMFDEAFARCVSTSFSSGLGMTANLNVDFRKPALPGRLYVLEAGTMKVEGRKAWVEGRLVCLPDVGNGEEGDGVMVAEARALFVEPKFAESMIPLYKG
ncbi:PaaI family thioesterase [Aspergillus ruber CBS 135680]|uniref:Thioesterase domain-containing protein n=1 Tax=Aspergillus ruber (strain CBS 135680) TaxID=1388766 RepID=A0A017SFK4_ASPRC|nr:uncharacterized protein EURHEDRAFT_412327 [Aspergillus ruber CBS 135680]EYE95025.1 hypothetical protein EURHEDRAFT_412327 [Aspergillus ruber CBS 135680]